MTNFHRVITISGDLIVVPDTELSAASYMWVDPDPLDLCPAMYDDTRLVELGDLVCCGGDEFRVTMMRPATAEYPRGQIRGMSGIWYSVKHAVLLSRDD